jgi:hypothetical protein
LILNVQEFQSASAHFRSIARESFIDNLTPLTLL